MKTIRIGFDPEKVGRQELIDVFADDVARALWLLWRVGHITNQRFDGECIAIAKRIRHLEPRTGADLRRCFAGFTMDLGSNFTIIDVDVALLELVPYLCGTDEEREPVLFEMTREGL